MTRTELIDHLAKLGLTQTEAARLLSVSARTVRRWSDGSQTIPGPAEMALRAWLGLHRRGLAWRPDGEAVLMDDSVMIARYRQHAMNLEALLRRANARGGPATPWQVNLTRGQATLGSLTVTFYKLPNGGFAPQSYRRSDPQEADLRRDWPLIEDAFVCIARKLDEQVHPSRTQIDFQAPQLDSGHLTMWDLSPSTPTAARIDCMVLREAWGLDGQVTDEACRLLALSNLDLLGCVAGAMVDTNHFTVGTEKHRILDIGHQELQRVRQDVNRSILNQPPVAWLR